MVFLTRRFWKVDATWCYTTPSHYKRTQRSMLLTWDRLRWRDVSVCALLWAVLPALYEPDNQHLVLQGATSISPSFRGSVSSPTLGTPILWSQDSVPNSMLPLTELCLTGNSPHMYAWIPGIAALFKHNVERCRFTLHKRSIKVTLIWMNYGGYANALKLNYFYLTGTSSCSCGWYFKNHYRLLLMISHRA